MSSHRVIDISNLKLGLPGVTVARGSEHYEACLVCLSGQNHITGVELKVDGDHKGSFSLEWNDSVTPQMLRAWEDEQESTEAGACGIAFLLILELTEYTVIRRSAKTTGFDYWLGQRNDDIDIILPFEEKARLEISGILKAEKESVIKSRVKQKIKQTNPSANTGLPAYVVVVEFSRPVAHVVKK